MCAVELWRRASPAPKDARKFESRDVGNVGRAGGCWGLIGILGCGHTRMVVPFVAIAVVAANLLLCVLSCDRKRRLLLRLSQRVYVHTHVCVCACPSKGEWMGGYVLT